IKLGDVRSFGVAPRREEFAGSEVSGTEMPDYKCIYSELQDVIKAEYKLFEVPYLAVDNDDYVAGAGFCCDDANPQLKSIPVGGDTYENLQYYYHPDHLGSASYITNLDGEVVQHIEYVPFGEVFLEERNNTWNTPFLFNGKEYDSETGLYYYGARYYNPRIGLWYGVDPLNEERYGFSPYQYCQNNPVMLTDPTGMLDDWVGTNNEDGTTSWSWNDYITSEEQAKAAGYDDYKAPGAIIDNAKINETSGTDGKTSVYLGNSAADVSFTWPNSTVTPFQVGTEWLSGKGPRRRDFTNGDNFTELLKTHIHVAETKNIILGEIANGAEVGKTGSAPYSLGGIQGVGKYVKDYSTLLTAGQTGNLAVTYLGSYSLGWKITGINDGSATVLFTINNISTMQSASRPPVVGYWPTWQQTVGKTINSYFSTGWGSKTSQSFNWTETISIK
ncbi:MAG: RHS repeat-associated core domain-containing protein, partial [Bacteroidales bacterium]